MVCPSTPADPALALTSCHAFAKTSSRYILSYSAWNRRVGLAFAARYRARWSSRALSRVVLACWALTSAYLQRTRRPSAAPSLHGRYPASSVPYEPLRLPLRSYPLRRLAAYRARRSQSTRRMAPHGSHCWGGDGPLLFPRRLCQRSTPPTPLGSSGLLVQDLHPFRGLRLDTRDSAPSLLLTEPILSTRQASLHAADRWLAPSQRGLDPALRRPGLPERRRAATKVTWSLLWPDLHRLVVVNFRTRRTRKWSPTARCHPEPAKDPLLVDSAW